ncbi:MAG: hypothetical protein ABSE73_32880, partial [Planctomycetota bacterium]
MSIARTFALLASLLLQTCWPQVTGHAYADNGKLGQINYPDGRWTKYVYDQRGRLAAKTSKGEGSTTYGYLKGDLWLVADALNHNTLFQYDTAHRLVETQYPGSGSAQRAYDPAGFLVGFKDLKGNVFQLDNYANGRRRQLNWRQVVEGTTIVWPRQTYSYDGNQPVNDGAITWTLDDAGRIASSNHNGVSCFYEHNHPLGLLTRKSYGNT